MGLAARGSVAVVEAHAGSAGKLNEDEDRHKRKRWPAILHYRLLVAIREQMTSRATAAGGGDLVAGPAGRPCRWGTTWQDGGHKRCARAVAIRQTLRA